MAAQLLGPRDPHIQGAADFNIALDVIRTHRLFKPQQVVFHQTLTDRNRRAAVIGAIGIHCEQNIVADGATHCRHILDVVVGAEADLHLHRLEALIDIATRLVDECGGGVTAFAPEETGRIGVDLAAKAAAEQLMDRLVECLAHEIPQRDIDAADRADIGALQLQAFPDHGVVKRAAADHLRFERAPRRHARALAPT